MINIESLNLSALTNDPNDQWLTRFATDNGLNYANEPQLEFKSIVVGNSISTNILSTPDQDFMIASAGVRMYDSYYGDYRINDNSSLARIKLPRKLPQMVIDSRHNSIKFLPDYYDIQEIKLEGNFSKHFKVYLPKNYHIDILQILTPDVMHALLECGTRYDYEITDDYLYIWDYRGIFEDSPSRFQSFLGNALNISQKFIKQSKTYSDHRANGNSGEAVTTGGARLRRSKSNRKIFITMLVALATAFFTVGLISGLVSGPDRITVIMLIYVSILSIALIAGIWMLIVNKTKNK